MRDQAKDPKIGGRRYPKHHVENERSEKLRQHDLPVAHGRGHERLDRAQFKLLRKEPHGDERKNQDKGEPEEDRVEESLLHRVADLALVHERDLEIKIHTAHEQEENENDVSDGRVEVAANFSRKEDDEFTHGSANGVMEWWSGG